MTSWLRTTHPSNVKALAAVLLGVAAALWLAVDGNWGPCAVAAAGASPWLPDVAGAVRRRGDR